MMKQILLVAVLALGLAGCDKLNKIDQMGDDVHAMSKKTDDLDAQVQKTNGSIDQTNKKLDGMGNSVDSTNNDGIRLYKMEVCLEAMDKEAASGESLTPVPTGLMAQAKLYAEATTADEFVQFTFLRLKEIDQVTPILKFGADGQEIPLSADEQYANSLKKYGKMLELQAIAGFLPDATVQQIIDQQNLGGAYRPTMLNILMMRAYFIAQDLISDQFLSNGEFASVGQAQSSVDYMKQVEFILRLPYSSQLFVKTTGIQTASGYSGPVANIDVKLDSDTLGMFTSIWGTIADMAEHNLTITDIKDSNDAAANEAEIAKEKQQQQDLVKEARAYADAWANGTPAPNSTMVSDQK